ncbi:uncharacterized protein At5g39865-like isoform X2 [Momordica charantia]|uniref:Uncharacterized protein At5g39865-like isoform X2 n=1 Tax=Momordica charantia TaxID=3673 RepID=A0A6J1D0B3_MOMCH|nr:uncharacterized protein At5g39865-like isoform X2 [Momordica charantia]
MWTQWLRSPTRVQSPAAAKPRSRHFSCSSFKDIQDLCREDSESDSGSDSPPTTPKRPSIFHRVRLSTSVLRSWSHRLPAASRSLPDSDRRIVLYHTSLRVVRRTFEDCRTVRSILRGFRVPIDERDLSMDSRFVDEFHEAVGGRNLSLPRVFVGGRYIGGAEEIRQLHESGELRMLIEGLPEVKSSSCEVCGGIRFVVCEECDGSHKIYVEKCGFRSCNSCNINGLIRCPSCSSMRLRSTDVEGETQTGHASNFRSNNKT